VDRDVERIEEWAAWMRGAHRSPKTIMERVGVVRLLGVRSGVPATHCGWRELADFLGNASFTASTVVTYYSALRQWYGWLRRMGFRADDPSTLLAIPKAPRSAPHPITTAELGVLLGRPLRPPRRMMILLGAYAGLRASEIAAIRGENLRGDRIELPGKGGHTDSIDLHDHIRRAATAFPDIGWWFPSVKNPGTAIKGNYVSVVLSQTMQAAGVHGTAHSLRHWYATEMLKSGANLRVVQENMRHANLATTARYTRVTTAERRAAIQALPEPLYVIHGDVTFQNAVVAGDRKVGGMSRPEQV
jgi:integrase/recombinase XerD